jgi:acyl-CoA reductase-like NAD-dependent aldehyde dehydrogenase
MSIDLTESSTAAPSFPSLDADLSMLRSRSAEWAALDLTAKADLLAQMRPNVQAVAEEWVRIACEAKGLDPRGPLAGEERLAGPFVMLTYLDALGRSLRDLIGGRSPLSSAKSHMRADGRLAVRILPFDLQDRLVMSGFHAETWLTPGVTREQALERAGLSLRGAQDGPGGVGLVLGAGNVAATAPLDVLYDLFAHNRVVICKLNPVNAYLEGVLRQAFAPFVERGFVVFTQGGSDIGSYLVDHPSVDHVHITGSNAAHDAIVWGTGDDAVRRRSQNQPRLNKPITSELGGVTATIILPGPWSKADIKFQADNIASQKLNNSGFNCTAAQVLVVPKTWGKTTKLLSAVRAAIEASPQRPAYYPGVDIREQNAVSGRVGVEEIEGGRVLIGNLDAGNAHEPFFSQEVFAPVLGMTMLDDKNLTSYLAAAVDFANTKLFGTLSVNFIAHPATIRELGGRLDDALVALKYGTIGINAWASVGYLTPRANWGAFPGHNLHDPGSGIGNEHNALLLADIERTIVKGPFRPAPRSLAHLEAALMPVPPWFVLNKKARALSEAAYAFVAKPGLRTLLKMSKAGL